MSIEQPARDFTLLETHLEALVGFARASEGKRFREQMVRTAASLAGRICENSVCSQTASAFADAIESIHLGSLVIDDIQDSSISRRGKPALHTVFGIPLSINAGNWFYFAALEGLTNAHNIHETRRVEAIRLLVCAMREAHEGQAIDLGVDMFETDRAKACTIVELAASKKTGALMSAAFGLGFLSAAEPTHLHYASFREFGHEWGIALQMLDDLGSLLKSVNGELPVARSFEDFRNGSPSFVWAVADELLDDRDYNRFKSFALSSRDPLGCEFNDWRADFEELARSSGLFAHGLWKTKSRIDLALDGLTKRLDLTSGHSLEIDQLTTLCRNLEAAYGNFERYGKSTAKNVAESVGS